MPLDTPTFREGIEDFAAGLEHDTGEGAAGEYLAGNLEAVLASQTDAEVVA